MASGVAEVILVVSDRPGNPVMAHFTEGVRRGSKVVFRSVVQGRTRGLGHAVLTTRDAVGDRPVRLSALRDVPRPVRRAFTHAWFRSLRRSAGDRRSAGVSDFFDRYGMVAIGEHHRRRRRLSAIEKPQHLAPSDLGIVAGRCVPTGSVRRPCRHRAPDTAARSQLTDAIDRRARREGALALIVGDDLLDIGRPAGLSEAHRRRRPPPDLADEFRAALLSQC